MSDHIGFEPAPDRSIWPELLNVADDPRLDRLLEEAHRMMTALRRTPASGETPPAVDVDWRDFYIVIEAEKNLREKNHRMKNAKDWRASMRQSDVASRQDVQAAASTAGGSPKSYKKSYCIVGPT
jgi:hypothetical protein